MSQPHSAPARLGYDEFIESYAGQKVCLIRGEVFPLAPVGRAHVGALLRLSGWLRTFSDEDGFHVREEKPLYALDSEPEPDIAVMRGEMTEHAEDRADADRALLIIEVADSTLRFDRTKKRPLYAEAGVAELWIVNVVDREIEVHRLPDIDSRSFREHRTVRDGDDIAPAFSPARALTVGHLFRDVV